MHDGRTHARPRSRPRSRLTGWAAALLAGVLVVAACGDDDDGGAAVTMTSPPPSAPASRDTGELDATTVASGATDATTADATAASGAAAFPATIEHKYGTTTIEAEPERVVSVGFTDQDALLAVGVVPVGIRDWYGDQPFATWPWAIGHLEGAEPHVLSSTELNFEQITALDPDLIVGLSSGMTEQDYLTLSGIAPTIAQSDEYIEYGVPWQEAMRVVGRAVGRSAAAEQVVTDTEALIDEVAAAHPEWRGLEAAVAYVLDEAQIGAYASGDSRPRLLAELGFVTPPEFDDLAGDQFYSAFSWEEIGRVDRDVVVWIAGEEGIQDQIAAHPMRRQLAAVDEGREIFLGFVEAGAFSFSSPLSLPYLLDVLVPQLEAAIDGDAATEVPAAE